MKVVALFSGGKDSTYSMMKCLSYGHEIVCLANLCPATRTTDELDSQMYQTVGHQNIVALARCLGLPLVREEVHGEAAVSSLQYQPHPKDEVEDLHRLLFRVKQRYPMVTAVCSGAILSNYQRLRVENVCQRLGLVSLGYLWQRDQFELLEEMVQSGLDAILIKVAAMGLTPKAHLGRRLSELWASGALRKLPHIHVCGEGGEYETLVVQAPLFRYPMKVLSSETIVSDDNPIAPVAFLRCTLGPDQPEQANQFPDVSVEDAVNPLDISASASTAQPASIPRFTVFSPLAPAFRVVGDLLCLGGLSWEIVASETDTLKHQDSDECEEAVVVARHIHLLLQYVQYRIENDHQLTLGHVIYTHLYVQSIELFASVNAAYCHYFGSSPPARATVGVKTLACPVVMEIYVRNGQKTDKGFEPLHVQSISEWAPACIGPYSQACRLNDAVFFAGTIGLIPETMTLPEDSLVESALALRSLSRVAKVMNCQFESSTLLLLVYLTDWTQRKLFYEQWVNAVKLGGDVAAAKVLGKGKSAAVQESTDADGDDPSEEANDPCPFCVRFIHVSGLPRGCRVEYQLLAVQEHHHQSGRNAHRPDFRLYSTPPSLSASLSGSKSSSTPSIEVLGLHRGYTSSSSEHGFSPVGPPLGFLQLAFAIHSLPLRETLAECVMRDVIVAAGGDSVLNLAASVRWYHAMENESALPQPFGPPSIEEVRLAWQERSANSKKAPPTVIVLPVRHVSVGCERSADVVVEVLFTTLGIEGSGGA